MAGKNQFSKADELHARGSPAFPWSVRRSVPGSFGDGLIPGPAGVLVTTAVAFPVFPLVVLPSSVVPGAIPVTCRVPLPAYHPSLLQGFTRFNSCDQIKPRAMRRRQDADGMLVTILCVQLCHHEGCWHMACIYKSIRQSSWVSACVPHDSRQ